MNADVFGTEALRAAVLEAWRASPARLREDANTEEDHARGYYRDRVLVELAQNAADAAVRAGVPGRLLLRLSADDMGAVLLAANTGSPLDAAGVASLASLRASAKRADDAVPGLVGRFGVGFAAVRAVSDDVTVLSTSGGVRFSAAQTTELLAAAAAAVPALAEEVRRREGSLPALRLPMPAAGRPPEGYDTAVVLRLRDEHAVSEVRELLADVDDTLLLALPGLAEIVVEDDLPDGGARRLADVERRWTIATGTGELVPALLADRPVEERAARTWRVTWALPRDGRPVPGVVHAPTPTDEPCSLPALLVATLPLDPSRRHVVPGAVADAVLDQAADVYARLAARVADEGGDPLVLVPSGWVAGALDGRLRERVVERLARTPLLAPAPTPGGARAGDEPALVPPWRAVGLDGAAGQDAGVLAALAGRVAGLVVLPPGRQAAARTLGVELRPVADLVEELGTVPDEDWRVLYDGLAGLAGADREALAALPVPLADGRVVRGARGLVQLAPDLADRVGADAVRTLARWGLRVVDPVAAHPLLARLGADEPDAVGLLGHPAVRAAVLDQADDDDLALADEVTAAVLAVLSAVVGDGARIPAGTASWLGLLTVAASDGEPTPAHGLVLPGSPAAALLDPRVMAPVAADVLDRWGSEVLVAAGVRDEPVVVVVADVLTDPDAEDPDATDDAALAAGSLDSWPEYLARLADLLGPGRYVEEVLAVADLDAVAPDSWADLLARLADVPELRTALLAPVRAADAPGRSAPSYTAWWLRTQGPDVLRVPFAVDPGPEDSSVSLAGLLPSAPDLVRGLDTVVQRALGGVADVTDLDADGWAALLEGLGPVGTPVPTDQAVTLWAGLAGAARAAREAGGEPPAPARVPALVAPDRAAVVHADDAAVADRPMWWQRTDVAALVPAAPGTADDLAVLLDLPRVEELAAGRVDDSPAGEVTAVPGPVRALLPDAPATWVEHQVLTVDGAPVGWWVEGSGPQAVVHAEHVAGLAAGLAQAAGDWRARYAVEAVLTDPERAAEVALDAIT